MPMITAFELYQYQIDLTPPLPVAKQRIDHRLGFIVIMMLDDKHQAFAEISPLTGIDIEGLPLTGFSTETQEQVKAELLQIKNQLVQQPLSQLTKLIEQNSRFTGQQRQFASIQFGLSVLAAKCQQQLPARQLPQAAIPLLYCGLTQTEIDNKLADLEHIHSVKIKVAQTDMQSEIAFVHQVLARKPELTLRLDANCGFTPEQAIDFLACLPKQQIEYIEEPCIHSKDNQVVYNQLGIKYALDESLLAADIDYQALLKTQPGIGALILKPMLIGSLDLLQDIVTEAEHCNVRCILSSSLESDVGIDDLRLISQALTPDNPPGLDTLSAFNQQLRLADGSLDMTLLKIIQ
ncbi:o-succinylbenzoate synthase [Shewanella aestuarii]|nr:o-succinylbenzoate synthase [Shewanella aestuarii]